MWVQPLRQHARRLWSALTAIALLIGALLRACLSVLKIAAVAGLAVALAILVIGNTVFRGDRDIAYRFAAPDAPECLGQETVPVSLASQNPSRDNDELAAIDRQPALSKALTCMVQVHQIEAPKDKPASDALRYYLSFLEFAENGSPADVDAEDRVLRKRQLDALVAHLRHQRELGKHSYVIAFVHGWRHNAGIDDGDVAKLRLMAAYTASFLRQRCIALQRDCSAVVTAVYFGWRGA